MKRLVIIAALFLSVVVYGQWAIVIKSENGYADNIFANYRQLPDYFSEWSVRVEKNWLHENKGSRIYYSPELTLFKHYRERNSHSHQFGFDYYRLWGSDNNRIDAGVYYQQRFFTDTYQLYEQRRYQAYLAAKYVLFPSWYTYWGGTIERREYPSLPHFSHHRVLMYGRNSIFLPSGTTLIGEADLLVKSYLPAKGEQGLAVTDIITLGGGESRQLLASVRLAQSLASRVGIYVEYQTRYNFTSGTRYLSYGDGFYYSDEEIFEDVFAYHGSAWSTGYNHRLPWFMRLSINGRYERRYYDQRPAADLEGNPLADGSLRSDKRTMVWMQLSKNIKLKQGWQPLTLSLNYSWIDNDSNDLYYRYQSSFFGVNLSHSF